MHISPGSLWGWLEGIVIYMDEFFVWRRWSTCHLYGCHCSVKKVKVKISNPAAFSRLVWGEKETKTNEENLRVVSASSDKRSAARISSRAMVLLSFLALGAAAEEEEEVAFVGAFLPAPAMDPPVWDKWYSCHAPMYIVSPLSGSNRLYLIGASQAYGRRLVHSSNVCISLCRSHLVMYYLPTTYVTNCSSTIYSYIYIYLYVCIYCCKYALLVAYY